MQRATDTDSRNRRNRRTGECGLNRSRPRGAPDGQGRAVHGPAEPSSGPESVRSRCESSADRRSELFQRLSFLSQTAALLRAIGRRAPPAARRRHAPVGSANASSTAALAGLASSGRSLDGAGLKTRARKRVAAHRPGSTARLSEAMISTAKSITRKATMRLCVCASLRTRLSAQRSVDQASAVSHLQRRAHPRRHQLGPCQACVCCRCKRQLTRAASGPHGHIVRQTCLSCGASTRTPAPPRPEALDQPTQSLFSAARSRKRRRQARAAPFAERGDHAVFRGFEVTPITPADVSTA